MRSDDPPLGAELRHIKRLALARLYRLVQGLLRKQCPANSDGGCYWCGRPIDYGGHYTGHLRGTHAAECPWNEVIAYAMLQDFFLDEAGEGTPGDAVDAAEPTERDGDDPGR